MDKLLMIADDLTGGLDAGVCFSAAGVSTCVCQDDALCQSTEVPDCTVLVCVAETRHLSKEDAYNAVYRVASAAAGKGFRLIFKKTDSALRGNVGAELAAIRSAVKAQRVYFLPAHPKMQRVVRDGVLYIDSHTPVQQSVFGADPFNPVRHSSVLDILRETTSEAVARSGTGDGALPQGILVFDGETERDILETARWVLAQPDGAVLAGCGGLASVLPQLLDLPRTIGSEPLPKGNLMVFCGSINPISLEQCRQARVQGAPGFQLIQDGAWADCDLLSRQIAQSAREHPVTVFTTGSTDVEGTDPVASGKRIARQVGRIIRQSSQQAPDAIVAVIGGDTLLEFLRQLKIPCIYPLRELFPGVVLAKYFRHGKPCYLISKSGGFGDRDLLLNLQRKLNPPDGNHQLGGV